MSKKKTEIAEAGQNDSDNPIDVKACESVEPSTAPPAPSIGHNSGTDSPELQELAGKIRLELFTLYHIGEHIRESRQTAKSHQIEAGRLLWEARAKLAAEQPGASFEQWCIQNFERSYRHCQRQMGYAKNGERLARDQRRDRERKQARRAEKRRDDGHVACPSPPPAAERLTSRGAASNVVLLDRTTKPRTETQAESSPMTAALSRTITADPTVEAVSDESMALAAEMMPEPTGETTKLRYWVTPADMKAAFEREFGPLFDPCPHPRPDGFDGLSLSWKTEGTAAAYCNPPFTTGFMAWVKKALAEWDKGVTVLLVVPMYQNRIIALLTEAGAEIRYIGVPNWLSLEDGTPNPAPMVSRQPCVLAILRARPMPMPIPCDIEKLKASGARHWWWGVPWPGANMTAYPGVNDEIDITRFARQEARRVRGERLSAMRVINCAGRDAVALDNLSVAAKDMPADDRKELHGVLQRLLKALDDETILDAKMVWKAEAAA